TESKRYLVNNPVILHRNHDLESELGWVSIALYMILVDLAALFVHAPGVPVAILGRRLRAPVRPDTELGVAKPFGDAIFCQRFACALEGRGWMSMPATWAA